MSFFLISHGMCYLHSWESFRSPCDPFLSPTTMIDSLNEHFRPSSIIIDHPPPDVIFFQSSTVRRSHLEILFCLQNRSYSRKHWNVWITTAECTVQDSTTRLEWRTHSLPMPFTEEDLPRLPFLHTEEVFRTQETLRVTWTQDHTVHGSEKGNPVLECTPHVQVDQDFHISPDPGHCASVLVGSSSEVDVIPLHPAQPIPADGILPRFQVSP